MKMKMNKKTKNKNLSFYLELNDDNFQNINFNKDIKNIMNVPLVCNLKIAIIALKFHENCGFSKK